MGNYSGGLVKLWNSEGCTILQSDKNMDYTIKNKYFLSKDEEDVIKGMRENIEIMSKHKDHWHYLIFYSLERELRRGINYFSFPLKSSKDVLKAEKIMRKILRNQGCD